MNDSVIYEFDSFQVDVRRRLLMREGQRVPVTPKAFEILLALVRSGGRVLSKDELMSTAWPDCFVEEGNLAQNIFLLRRILGEQKNEHKFIITIPGVGYRFAPYVIESAAVPPQRRVTAGANDEQLRISVQLIVASTGTMLWAKEFDAQYLFQLQDALSEQVATALAEKV
jgi:DNA-binding winged helix-turn-helix (wHTH) protein